MPYNTYFWGTLFQSTLGGSTSVRKEIRNIILSKQISMVYFFSMV
jgi:hypothetical protein